MAKRPKPIRPAKVRPSKRAGPDARGRAAPLPVGVPSRDQLLAFIRSSQETVGKREIIKAFGIKGSERGALKDLLAELADEGLIAGNRKELREKGSLPPVTVLEITGRDDGGDLVAVPAVWEAEDGERPQVLILPAAGEREAEGGTPAGVGDRVLARVSRLEDADIEGFRFEARIIKRLPREKRRLLGIFRRHPRGGGTIEPIDRRELRSWTIQAGDDGDAADGDLVRFDLAKKGRFGVPQARVVEALGNPTDQRKISLIAVHAHGIPDDFPERVLAEVEALAPPTREGRTDLTSLPLVTIDPVDARDHDDAVYATPDGDPANPGGHVVLVAIADVAHYVRPGSRLDREAQIRGNSVYFPDRVVPMLPERISNDLCSLREGELRPCLAVRMVFDRSGTKRSHEFQRALMRSAAKLSYQEAQAAIDGKPSDKCGPLLEPVLKPLWAAYATLAAARERRGPLDLDLPERKIILDAEGRVARVHVPERLAAHRLIEEMMIQANVAAAETLEARRAPVVYRVHAEPSKEKLAGLKDFLDSLDMKLPAPGSGALRPAAFNRILEKAKDLPVPSLVSEVILRSQSQAEYACQNIGHFGLNLAKYAHFTSPIRRYADLVVHRALVGALKLGEGAFDMTELPRLPEVAKAISDTERRAMAAERETTDRLIAAHLADRIGAEFPARISGVTRSALFVRLNDTGADGYLPASSLGNEFFAHDEARHAMVGTRSGTAYRLGDAVTVRLVEAIPTAGALRFEMVSEGSRTSGRDMPRGFRGRGLPRNRRPGR